MTELEYIAKCAYLLRQQGETVPTPQAIQATLGLALQAVGRLISDSTEYSLRQKEYPIVITSGVGSLSTATDMIVDRIDTVQHPDILGDSSNIIQYFSRIPDGTRADLAGTRNTMFPPYVVELGTIYCSLGNGTWPDASDKPPNATLLVTASQMPDLTTLPVQYEDDLIMKGASFAAAAQAAAQGA